MMKSTKVELFEALAEHIAKYECLADGKITWTSRPMELMFGYRVRDSLVGESMESLIPGFLENIEASELVRPMIGKRKDGSEFPVNVLRILRASDKTLVVIGIVRDMTTLNENGSCAQS